MVSTPARKSPSGKKKRQSKRRQDTTQPAKADAPPEDARPAPELFANWQHHLANREPPVRLRKIFGSDTGHPVLWLLNHVAVPNQKLPNQEMVAWLTQAFGAGAKSTRREALEQGGPGAEPWLAESEQQPVGVGHAVECLLWAYVLPELAAGMPSERWWQLHDYLLSTARQCSQTWNGSDLLLVQLLAIELPLVLAQHFPELAYATPLRKTATTFLSHSITELLDGEGLPHAQHLHLLPALFACWTRCYTLIKHTGKPGLRKTAKLQYEWLLRQVLRLSAIPLEKLTVEKGPVEKGTVESSLSQQADLSRDETNAAVWSQLFTLAARLSTDKTDHGLVKLRRYQLGLRDRRPRMAVAATDAAYQSDWAEVAVLRTDWSARAAQLLVCHDQRSVRVSLRSSERTLLAGEWMPQWTVDGKSETLAGDWHVVCWFSDDDVDYLELEGKLSGGWKWQRQFLLAREDAFLFSADALLDGSSTSHGKHGLGNGKPEGENAENGAAEIRGKSGAGKQVPPHEIEYAVELPLANDVAAEMAAETHELTWRAGGKRAALWLPLSLPEWRRGTPKDRLQVDAGRVTWRQSGQAQRFVAASFLDLHPKRSRQTPTWRALTIADNLRIVGTDEAVGYRVQVGPEQWLFYRSLCPTPSRTMLGQHLSSEFLAGRFLNNGDMEGLIEVQGE